MNRGFRPAICIVVENQPVPPDRRVWLEACALSEAGYRVSVIAPKGPGHESDYEILDGIEIFRHPTWTGHGHFAYFFEYAYALALEFYLVCKVFARTRFRILQACNPPDTMFLIALAFRPFGIRFVFDHHDLSPELYETKFGGRGLIYKVLRLAEWLTFRVADLSIATNESYREIAITRGKMNPNRVVVVQTGADLDEVHAAQPVPELKRGRKFMVLYVGVMELQDGLRNLMESIDYLVNQRCRDDAHFVLIGSGTELPRLKALSTRLGLEKCVEFTGYLRREQLSAYLSTADVCVAPDPLNPLNDNCTMIKNLEYMAHSRPVVLYDLKEGRRTLGESALYAHPNDAMDFANQIEKLLDSEPLRKQLGECGRQRTETELNWKVQSTKLIEAFDSLL